MQELCIMWHPINQLRTYDFCLKSRTKKFSKPLYFFIHGTFQMEYNHGRTNRDVQNHTS